MCIIVAKNKGVEVPSRDILQNCFDYNSHGAGLMYVSDNKVMIEKGFMNFDSFYKRIVELGKSMDLVNKCLVMHFRISTSGLIDQGNCHPYPITNEDHMLRELFVETDLGMVHNGIIAKHIPEKHSVLNDTQTFIKNFVHKLYTVDSKFLATNDNLDILEKEAGSKLCFLDKEDNMYTVGGFLESEGVLYSNDTYLPWDYAYTWDDSEFDFSEYCEMIDFADITLSDMEFFDILGTTHLLKQGVTITNFGEVIQNDGNVCVDDFNNVYKIDWEHNMFEYVGEMQDVM